MADEEAQYRGYLDFPRIHFYGRFRADPGTNNNGKEYYKAAALNNFEDFEKKVYEGKDSLFFSAYKTWGQYGDMSISFYDCNVTRAYDYDSTNKKIITDDTTYSDFEINPLNSKLSGRMCDLDPDAQLITRIYGFSIIMCDKNDKNKILLKGNYDPSSFQNGWPRAENGFESGVFSTEWISVLTDCEFGDDISLKDEKYSVVRKLKAFALKNGNKLQLKLITDGYSKVSVFTDGTDNPAFNNGRVYGMIGLFSDSEYNPSKSIKFGRYLFGTPLPGPPGALPSISGEMSGRNVTIKYDFGNSILHVDLSNALPTHKYRLSAKGTSLEDQKLDPEDEGKYLIGEPINKNIGDIDIVLSNTNVKVTVKSDEYAHYDAFSKNCGIFSFAGVNIDQNVYYSNSLVVTYNGDLEDNKPVTSNEAKNGYYAHSENLQIRLGTVGVYARGGKHSEYGKDINLPVYVSKYGKPATGAMVKSDNIVIECTSTQVPGQTPAPQNAPEGSVVSSWGCDEDLELNYNSDDISNGLLNINVKSPDTMKSLVTKYKADKNGDPAPPAIATLPVTDIPPRWQAFCMDSFLWNLTLSIGYGTECDANESNNLLSAVKKLGAARANIRSSKIVKAYNIDHESGKRVLLARSSTYTSRLNVSADSNAKKTRLLKVNEASADTGYYFMATSCVYAEIDPNDLAPVVTWQKSIVSDETAEDWSKMVSNQYKSPYIRVIFRQYSNLYPVMRHIVNLDSYDSVTMMLESLKRAFSASYKSAHYMPITRDLSGMNQILCQLWFENPIFCNKLIDRSELKNGFFGEIQSINRLKEYLQAAIELELSTLAPYLSALYSMNPNSGTNTQIIQLIREITHEEMLHLNLACNMLLSLNDDYKDAIPSIPRIAYKDVMRRCNFPRKALIKQNGIKVLPKLKLELQPMNLTSTIETFMTIEAPCKFDFPDNDSVETLDTRKFVQFLGPNSDIARRIATNLKLKANNNNNSNNSGGDTAVTTSKTDATIAEFLSEPGTLNDNHSVRAATYVAKSIKMFSQSLLMSDEKETFTKNTIRFTPYTEEELKEESEDSQDSKSDENKTDAADSDPFLDKVVTDVTRARHSIGAMYQIIKKGFIFLSLIGNRDKDGKIDKDIKLFQSKAKCIDTQIGPETMPGSNYVFDLKTALTAIDTIITEGEGTSLTDIRSNSDNLSHFHKFVEIYYQKPIVAVKPLPNESSKKDFKYEYVFAEGVDIAFDEKSVSNDASAWDWLKLGGNRNEHSKNPRVIAFNTTFGKLLVSLQEIFGNGKKDEFNRAVSLMRQLQIQFEECVRPKSRWSADTTSPTDPLIREYTSVAPDWVAPEDMLF